MSSTHRTSTNDVVIIGGGIAGLTLALQLHERGLECTVYEAAPELRPLGVGISLLPHGTQALAALGLLEELERRAVKFTESAFFTSHGQLVHRDPATSTFPQFLIHRADLHEVLHDAVIARLGADALRLGQRCAGVREVDGGAAAMFVDVTAPDDAPSEVVGRAVIGCDGIHSRVRAQFYPDEGPPVFTGVNMWRGVTVHPPILSGSAHIRIGTVEHGKMVVYPIRDDVDGQGNQLVNWVAEVRQEAAGPVDWSAPGNVEDFISAFSDWRFDWLDVPELIRNAEAILEYPMSDRDPLDRWTFGHVTLVGDAAHPMIPRGSNGAMQAIVDTVALAEALADEPGNVPRALATYEDVRREKVNNVVLTNRVRPPDHLIEVVEARAGREPFARLEDVISSEEITSILDGYKNVAGYSASVLGAAR